MNWTSELVLIFLFLFLVAIGTVLEDAKKLFPVLFKTTVSTFFRSWTSKVISWRRKLVLVLSAAEVVKESIHVTLT